MTRNLKLCLRLTGLSGDSRKSLLRKRGATMTDRELDEEIGIQIDQSQEQTVRRAIVLAAAEIGKGMK